MAVEHALKEADSDDIILAFGSLSYLGRITEILDEYLVKK